MTRLAARDLAAVATFARNLNERASVDVGAPEALDAMLDLVRADAIEWGVSDEATRQIIELRHYPSLVILRGSEPFLAAANGPFWESRPTCPICGPSRVRTRGAIILSDLADTSHAHPQHFQCAGIDVIYQMNLFMQQKDSLTRHVAFSRAPGLDFDERDRLVLELAGVFITQHVQTLDARHDADAVLAAFEAGGEDGSRGLIVLDQGHHPSLISPEGVRLLRVYFDWRPGARRLPIALERWLDEGDLVAEEANGHRSMVPPLRRVLVTGELTIRSVPLDGRVAIIMEERQADPQDARSLLTAREREVLDAVAEGLTNAQIAERLWVSPATIGKHLENAFAKLEVRSRAAAVALTRGVDVIGHRRDRRLVPQSGRVGR
jgi:DNA-binding CsgD family transcriptional regulator